jgi:PKD repeat protein
MRMLWKGGFALFFLFLFSFPVFAGTQFQATTTLTAETSNNTSTASSFAAQTNGNLGPSNISKMPIRSLLYAGSTAKIYTHFMPWFGFGDHMNVGYVSTDTLQIQKQVTDMVSRGLDGAIIDWYGRGSSSKHYASYDQATQSFMHEAELHPGFHFAINDDAGSLKTCSTTVGCDVTQTLIDDLNYAIITFSNSPSYLTSGSRPVIYFFGHEAYTIDWTRVRAGVAGNPMFIFRNGGGFTTAESDGAFSWVAPETVTATNLMALTYLNSYYKTATTSFPTAYSTGSGYKGFNDTLALWGTGRIIDQQCGQTWLKSVADANNYYSSTKQIMGIQLVTWNDYEEGSEIETGIDNCVTVSAGVTGTIVSWSITGQMNTVDHFTVFASQDGENLMWLADAPTTAASIDLAQFKLNSGNYIVYVKAVGKPSLTNKMSAGVQLTVPNLPPVAALSVTPSSGVAPVTVNASTAGASDPDGTITATSIDFGDGSAPVSAASASHVYNAAGTYTVTATVTDNLGASSVKSATVVVTTGNQAPIAALVVTPSSGIAPVTVTASTAGSSDPDGTIAATSINFGDGSAAVSAASATHVYSTPGTYTVTATVTDNLGAASSKSATVTVATTNKPPVAVISATPSSAYGPVSVSVSAAGSSDPDGTIAGTVLDFGDGTSASAITATHTYAAAGTYTLTATVTDNQGASSTASTAVTVKAPEVIVSSPASGTSVASQAHVVASGFSGNTVTAMQIYLDSTLAYQVSAASLDTTLALTAGAHSLTIKGWDSGGRSFAKTLSVTATNQPPVVSLNISSGAILVGGSISASTAGSSDPDGTIVSTTINFGDGSAAVSATSATHVYSAPGTYTVIATVTDNLGAASSKSATVTVGTPNQPPIAVLSLNSSSILVGGTINASTAGSSDPDGAIAGTVINFGDGSSAAAGSASHQYKAAGTYTVKATVTDNLGASSSTSKTVVVKPQFVTITSPAFNSTTSGSMVVSGSSHSGYPIMATQIYMDGSMKYKASGSTASTTLSISQGTHQITIQGWDSSGAVFKSSVTVTRN